MGSSHSWKSPLLVAFALASLVGCKSPEPFACNSNSSCLHDGVQGICESNGYCSFPNTGCASARSYGEDVPDDLVGKCVPPPAAGDCISQLSFGAEHSCALEKDGSVWCWGSNAHSQIGNGATDVAPAPTKIEGIPAGVTKLSAGEDHTCVLTDAGEVWCWGSNESGQLGGTTGDPAVPIADTSVPVKVEGIAGATDVSGGGKHTCAVAGGDVYCWGSNGYAQLGTGDKVDVPAPVKLTGVTKATLIDAGDEHTCTVQEDGRVFCWGTNGDGQGGFGESVPENLSPTQVTKITGAASIAVGDEHTCIQRGDETIWCWGYNGSGGVGNGSFNNVFDPIQVLTGPTVVTGASSFHTCAIVEHHADELWCWGANDDGQIGSGSREKSIAKPQRVQLATLSEIVATGATHTCAVTQDGTLWCWGNNESGQLGTGEAGDPEFSPRPVSLCQ
jgi:alpha-tubulin suppressor-like RCC1 family protein